MWDLFKAECLRFRSWAAAYAATQLAALAFMTRVVDLAQQPPTVYQTIGCVYGLTGILLGLYQMGTYRRPNTWVNLLHRPLPHWQVLVALAGAAAVMLAIAVLLPVLVIALWQETMTPRVVDSRHLLLACSGLAVALCGYFAACYTMLANRRHGWCALALLLFLPLSAATGIGALVMQLLLAALLAALVLSAFKPDLQAAPRGGWRTLLAATTVQAAMWVALVGAGFAVELVWIAQGSHPNNREIPKEGGEKQAETADGKDLIAMGLAGVSTPDAALWREQVRLSEIVTTGPDIRFPPARHELMNRAPMEFDDAQRRIRWVFSHDDMRFHGYSLADRRSVGVLGVDGDAPFDAPPLPLDDNLLASAHTLYQYDSEAQRIAPRLHVPAGETLTGMQKAGDQLAVLSDRAFYLYDTRGFTDTDAVLKPRARAPLPGRSGDLVRVDLMELLDGTLASFLFSYSSHNAEGALPSQVMLRVNDDGAVAQVARRALHTDYPPAWRYQNWYPSPAWYAVQKAALSAFRGVRPDRDMAMASVPRSMQSVALVLMLLSALVAAWRVRRIALAAPARIAWVIACAVLSLPALASLWLLYPPVEVAVPESVAHSHPATT